MAELLTRSASLTGFAELARSLGLDPYRMLANEGLPPACLSDPDLKVPAERVGRLLETAAGRSGAEDFGLRLAEARRLSNLGAVAFVLREQPTLMAVIEGLVRYAWAQNQALTLRMEVEAGTAVLRAYRADQRGRQGIELSLAVIALSIRQLVGSRLAPREVRFMHSRPMDLSTHRRVFGIAPSFDQEFDALVFDERDLKAPVAGADPVAADRARRYLEWDAGHRAPDTAATVKALILALLPTGTCSIKRVASLMGISRRTLHRRLADGAGMTFERLVDEIRVELARRHIAEKRYPLTEVAELLGYGSLSAFSRWRRHHDVVVQ